MPIKFCYPERPGNPTELARAEHALAQGRYSDTEPLLKRALAIQEKVLGPDHLNVGISLNNLARLYQVQGRYADAEQLYKRALAIQERAIGPDHPNSSTRDRRRAEGSLQRIELIANFGTSLNNLALLYHAQGRYPDAEALFKRSLTIQEKAVGPDHLYVANSLSGLAILYQTEGRYADAEPLFKRALEIQEKVLGSDHPNVATFLNNLARLYQAQGHYADAEPLYKRSLSIQEEIYWQYFQTPGVAEAEFERDVEHTVRTLLYGKGVSLMMKPGQGFLADTTIPEQLPTWLSDQDLRTSLKLKRSGYRGGLNWYRNIDRNWELSAAWEGMKIAIAAEEIKMTKLSLGHIFVLGVTFVGPKRQTWQNQVGSPIRSMLLRQTNQAKVVVVRVQLFTGITVSRGLPSLWLASGSPVTPDCPAQPRLAFSGAAGRWPNTR